jgi:hypothetical protein
MPPETEIGLAKSHDNLNEKLNLGRAGGNAIVGSTNPNENLGGNCIENSHGFAFSDGFENDAFASAFGSMHDAIATAYSM